MTSTADSHLRRVEELERWLLQEYGPILRGASLRKLLGYRTADAFRQAIRRQKVPVGLFTLPEGACCSASGNEAPTPVRKEGVEASPLLCLKERNRSFEAIFA